MQKFSILLISFFAISLNLIAQQFQGGLTAGIVGSQVDGDTYKGYNKAGITAGGWASLTLNDHSAVQLELNYIQKGSRHNPDTILSDIHTYLIRVAYVEMPLLYQYRMKNRFYIEAGPSLGVLLSHLEKLDYNVIEDIPFRLLDVGFQAGVGFRFNDAVSVGIRSGNSLLSIRNGQDIGYRRRFGSSFGQYNNVMAIELHYSL